MISVIIPIYNAERFLKKCIESLLSQSFTDFELLLIDDGSTDGSGVICDGFAFESVRVFHTENRGVAAARNLGIIEARGEYITFIDADDCVPENYLFELFSCIGNADISVCDVALYQNGKETRRFFCEKQSVDGKTAVDLLLRRKEVNTGPCAKLFRASVVKNIHFPSLRLYEDILFVLESFDKASCVAFTSKTEYAYICNGDSAMQTLNAEKCLDVVTATEQICAYIDEKGGGLANDAFYTSVSHLMQYFIFDPKNEAEKALDKAIIGVFAKYRRLIKNCKAFSFKEKLIYLAASKNIRIKNGFGKLIK